MTQDNRARLIPSNGSSGTAARRSTAQRRQRLLAVATELIRERGYEAFSVNELAERAGMSVGGLYRYITTKSDVLVMVCEGIYGSLRTELVEVAAAYEILDEKLAAVIETYLRACATTREHILLMYREYRHLPPDAQQRYMAREQAIADVFGDLVLAGVRCGAFRPVDPPVVSHAILVLGHLPALKGWMLGERDGDAEYIRQQADLIMNSLRRD